MKKTILKSLILLLSIPLINSILFGLAKLVHEMHYATISVEQYTAYQTSMAFVITAIALSILIIEALYNFHKINNKIASILYFLVFLFIASNTIDQFVLRPYEHSLTFFSITTVVFNRKMLSRLFKPQIVTAL